VLQHVKGPVTPDSIAKAFESAGTITTGILPPLKWSGQNHLGTEQVQRVTVQGGKFVAAGGFINPPAVLGQ
jgi:branched-chain amino acid transport system substrate-binding protein